ncbi:MAG: hypothetical protein IJX83_04795 [Lachnospiraceae bacterium]|nr:hypothetical protein [Lachnospiraceae bacterium]
MFGYVVVSEQDLKIREFNLYRSYYCGMCMDLKEHYGQTGRLTLSYDTVFLALLLTSLYEPEDLKRDIRCAVHPVEKHAARQNDYTRYAADINIILSYYSCLDDWNDEKDPGKKLFAALLKKKSDRACLLYPEKAAVIRGKLGELDELEKKARSGEEPVLTPAALLDRAGSIFGDLLAEVFDCRKDTWSPALRRIGFNLGKFIYILDAYDDLEKDEKNGSFNPLAGMKDKPHLDDYVRGVLTMTLSDCTGAFETLPVVENIDILRNILYCGIWCKFEEVFKKRTGVTEGSGDSTERTAQDECSV